MAQSSARIFDHANTHRCCPEEIGSEHGPKANCSVPRQRAGLEKWHRSERNKAEAGEDRPFTYPSREHRTATFIRQTDQTGSNRLNRSDGIRYVEQQEADVVERAYQIGIDLRAKRRSSPYRRTKHHDPGCKNTADKLDDGQHGA